MESHTATRRPVAGATFPKSFPKLMPTSIVNDTDCNNPGITNGGNTSLLLTTILKTDTAGALWSPSYKQPPVTATPV